MNDNLSMILGVEALCGAQGIAFRAPLTTSAPLQNAIRRLRDTVPALEADRYLAPDLQSAAELIQNGTLVKAAGLSLPLECAS